VRDCPGYVYLCEWVLLANSTGRSSFWGSFSLVMFYASPLGRQHLRNLTGFALRGGKVGHWWHLLARQKVGNYYVFSSSLWLLTDSKLLSYFSFCCRRTAHVFFRQVAFSSQLWFVKLCSKIFLEIMELPIFSEWASCCDSVWCLLLGRQLLHVL